VAIGAVGAVETGYGTALLTRVENAGDAVFAGLYLGRAGAWSILAVASVWVTARHVARHRALAGLAAELETAAEPGSLAATLRAVTGDPDLEVLYPVGRDGRHVGADGRSASATTASGRTATPLRRGAETVAVLWHDPTVLPVDALDQVLGSAARLALENERLAAERLARMHDVQESRHRIVATGDEARRRLERDLHDGAQQSLLALSYMLRLARASADRTGQTVVVAELDRGLVQTQSALDDLRDLAHGIHPAVLSEAGLAAALRSLAERSAVPLELAAVTAERFTASIELAVYAVVRDAAERADPERTAALAVRVGREDGLLVVHVDGHDGRVPAEIADRLGALAGEVRTTADGVRVVLPCAS
jgi:signal transduction histidine kinase